MNRTSAQRKQRASFPETPVSGIVLVSSQTAGDLAMEDILGRLEKDIEDLERALLKVRDLKW